MATLLYSRLNGFRFSICPRMFQKHFSHLVRCSEMCQERHSSGSWEPAAAGCTERTTVLTVVLEVLGCMDQGCMDPWEPQGDQVVQGDHVDLDLRVDRDLRFNGSDGSLAFSNDEAGLHGWDGEGKLLQSTGGAHVPVPLPATSASATTTAASSTTTTTAAASMSRRPASLYTPQQIGNDFCRMLSLVGIIEQNRPVPPPPLPPPTTTQGPVAQ
ncbi:hypothetical protein EYF80_001305 [Liparis tanakae]|uniref:Uncharacterized protein n=1 Tax=Liparis tanakae TaxID=230148 RepID=A0A4Z2JH01_9TELE|nr:hypothetical protein EYF80_001305 [Liparis tanakae]